MKRIYLLTIIILLVLGAFGGALHGQPMFTLLALQDHAPLWSGATVAILAGVGVLSMTILVLLWHYRATQRMNRLLAEKVRGLEQAQTRLQAQAAELDRANRQLAGEMVSRRQAELALISMKHDMALQVDCVNRMQSRFIGDVDQREFFETLLLDILKFANSAFGFIAEVGTDGVGASYLHNLAISNISWDEETKRFYEAHAATGLRFDRLRGLYGAPVLSGAPVIVNDPAHDPRRCGLPPGHPPLSAFLGLPIKRGQQVIGVLGLANRPNGYDQTVVDYLQSVLTSCAQVIDGYRHRRQRNEAERALREREAQYRALFESAPDAIILSDPDSGAIVDANASAIQLLGKPLERIRGEHHTRLYPPALVPKIRIDFLQHAAMEIGVSSQSFESQLIADNGTSIPVEVTETMVTVAGKRMLQGIFRNIAERKRMEEILRTSEQRYRHYFEMAQIGMATLSVDHLWLHVNNRLCELLGYPREELLTLSCAALTHPDDLQLEDVQLQRVLRGQLDGYSTVKRFVRKDGAIVYASIHSNCVRNPDGQVDHFVVIIIDLTARIRMEQALLESESRFRDLFVNTLDGIAIADSQGCFVEVNPAFARMVGYPQEIFAGMEIRNIHPPMDVPWILEVFQSMNEGKVATASDIPVLRVDGEVIIVEIVGFHCKIGDRQYLAGSFRDITARKRLEDAMIKARLAAEAASRSKSNFLAAMSHDIRAPMNTILGMGELLLDTPVNDQQRHYLQIQHRAGECLLSLINDILDLSKIEAGQLEMASIPMDLRQLASDTMEMFRVDAMEQHIGMELSMNEDIPAWIKGDPQRLRQVLINLLGNAIKFTERGKVRLAICRCDKDDYLFGVRDTGIGIASDRQQAIFQPFLQESPDTAKKYGGTGLGLSICRQLVERMSGRIWVESAPDMGSVFYFTARLPEVVHSEHAMISQNMAGPSPRSDNPATVARLRILLVDDAEDNRLLIQAFLSKENHHLTMAVDGGDALAKFQPANFDLILMDIQMPDIDGYQVTRRMRELERQHNHPPTTIVALTAYATRGDTEQALEAGCDRHLTKPLRKNQLLELIHQVVPIRQPFGYGGPSQPMARQNV